MTDLAEALRERGFAARHRVRIAFIGSRKIAVIKTVRELTGWGLKDSKDAVEGCATVLTGLDPEAAEQAATKLRKAGATIVIDLDELCLYGFDPADPRRGDQPLERIRIVDLGVALEHGRLGEWTPSPSRTCNVDELLATVDAQHDAWARAGKQQETDELAILERLSARERTFEDRLRSSEGEVRLREAAVYGDWLQAQGDPRGLIAAVALTGDQPELARLCAEHESHLFGPTRDQLDPARWSFAGPVLDTLELGFDPQPSTELPSPSCARVRELLALPICACLRSLAVQRPIDHDVMLGKVLTEAACAPGLRELRISFAQHLGPMKLPALRTLDVSLSLSLAPLAASFVDLEAPALEHFSITVHSFDFWDQNFGSLQSNLRELLSQPSFARLRTLTLRVSLLLSGFADELARIPAISTLERIDLRDAEMTTECRSELERSRDRLPDLLL